MELVIAVPDQPGVLSAVAGVLAMHRLTVRTAELRGVGLPVPAVQGPVLLLNWRVAAEYGSLPQAARLRADLVRALDGSLDIAARLAERDAAYPRRRRDGGAAAAGDGGAAGSRLATVIEVRAQDAPGLLHRIGRALEAAGVRVRSAHVSTLGANAVDAFYVTGDGAPLPGERAAGWPGPWRRRCGRRRTGTGAAYGQGTADAECGALAGEVVPVRGSPRRGPRGPRSTARTLRTRAPGAGRYPGGRPIRPPHAQLRASGAPSTRGFATAVFDTLSDRLAATFKNLRGKGRLSEADIDATAREIRIALLEADVALPVVRAFIKQVKERAAGAEVSQALNPAQQVIKIVNEELIGILGGETRRLRFAKNPPTVIMLAGLQGAGKTTLAGKLGLWLKGQGHSPLLVACDLQRPNAVNQLSVVAERAGVGVYAPEPGNGVGDPVKVAKDSIEFAKTKQYDVVIVDTAGRLGIDQELMRQAADIRDAVSPDEVLFVVDAMIGQDAVNTAESFRDGVGFDGVVLSKLDGDARGGAALSIAQVTGRQIMFASNGEKLDEFDAFHPDRMASRILGMGDMLTLIEKAEQTFSPARGREDGRQAAAARAQGLHARRLPGPDGAGQEDGQHQQAARDDARHGPDQGPDQQPGRAGRGPHRRDHQVDDARRARGADDHQRLAPRPYRQGLRRRGQRRQEPGRAVLRGPQDDVADGPGRRHAGHARDAGHGWRRRQAEEAAEAGQGQAAVGQPDEAQAGGAGGRRPPRAGGSGGPGRRLRPPRAGSSGQNFELPDEFKKFMG